MSCLATVHCLWVHTVPSRRGWLALLLGLISVEPTLGAPPTSGTITVSYEVRGLRDTAIRTQNGTASDIASVEQTVDGYLWLATLSGLFRHDGARFETELSGRLPQAYHTNLSSGRYEFQVMAANEDGVGSTAGAMLQFDVRPALYWILSFKIAVGVGLSLVVALWFVVRTDQMKRRYRRGVEARHAERKRIARDIHDTLLQGVQALLFRLQIWEDDPNIPESLRREIAAVSHQTKSMVLEGRERILGMRSADTRPVDLIESLALIGGNAAVGETAFEIKTVGEVRSLATDAQEQLIDIAREGVRNAYRHAEASRISVNVEYHKDSLHVSIADDGHGFDQAAAEGRVKSAHFGLMGMRERARQLGAQFHIRSKSTIGTRIEVIVPARAAYDDGFKWPWRPRPEAGGHRFKDRQPEER
jgi:signal transduction histidine kinase